MRTLIRRNARSLAVLAASLSLLSLPAHADRLGIPADAPPAFAAECSGCHVAYPPKLLTAGEWQQVMRSLDKHYGDNATLDEKTRRTIEDFLVRNAGKPKAAKTATETGTAPAAVTGEAAPRITTSPWFKRKHHEVARADWTNPKVKSAANCLACHTGAERGSYREREIVMPDGRRWHD